MKIFVTWICSNISIFVKRRLTSDPQDKFDNIWQLSVLSYLFRIIKVATLCSCRFWPWYGITLMPCHQPHQAMWFLVDLNNDHIEKVKALACFQLADVISFPGSCLLSQCGSCHLCSPICLEHDVRVMDDTELRCWERAIDYGWRAIGFWFGNMPIEANIVRHAWCIVRKPLRHAPTIISSPGGTGSIGTATHLTWVSRGMRPHPRWKRVVPTTLSYCNI